MKEGRDRQKAISPMSDEAAAMPRESSAREPVFGEMAAEWRIAAEWSVPTAPPGALPERNCGRFPEFTFQLGQCSHCRLLDWSPPVWAGCWYSDGEEIIRNYSYLMK